MDSGDNSLPGWLIPPPDGWRADDLDRLPPDAPRHIELIDGGLFFMVPQKAFHAKVINALYVLLASQVTEGLAVTTEMTVRLGERQRPEPDLLVVNEDALVDDDRTWFRPGEVHLVVEVVSPESATRDTLRKPQLYAQAGIRHFWRVEQDGSGHAVLFSYELDPATSAYVATGIHRETMRLAVPFPLEVPVHQLNRWRRLKLS